MTLIEFFEKSVAENICTSIVHAPDRVILIGYQKNMIQKHAERYHDFFLQHGFDIDFQCKIVDKNKEENTGADGMGITFAAAQANNFKSDADELFDNSPAI